MFSSFLYLTTIFCLLPSTIIASIFDGSGIQVGDTQLPLCFPPGLTSAISGRLPKSAITTRQTGDNCNRYGNPPASILSNSQPLDQMSQCAGEIVEITDNSGLNRRVCMFLNPNSTRRRPLPLLVWLQPSLSSQAKSFSKTGWDDVKMTQLLNNEDDDAVGFSYIAPLGRNTQHRYPIPDDTGIGWDNWYRNLDRFSDGLNADVDLIDKAIRLAKRTAPVDHRRVFMSGWSNGASMALMYASNTDGIASASVYSAPDPYRDSVDPCTQVPHPRYATPTQDVHNDCDIIGTCTTARYYYTDLQRRYSRLQQSFVVIDSSTTEVTGVNEDSRCDPTCRGACGVTRGTLAHTRFPTERNTDTFFAFLYHNPLPESGSWGSP